MPGLPFNDTIGDTVPPHTSHVSQASCSRSFGMAANQYLGHQRIIANMAIEHCIRRRRTLGCTEDEVWISTVCYPDICPSTHSNNMFSDSSYTRQFKHLLERLLLNMETQRPSWPCSFLPQFVLIAVFNSSANIAQILRGHP